MKNCTFKKRDLFSPHTRHGVVVPWPSWDWTVLFCVAHFLPFCCSSLLSWFPRHWLRAVSETCRSPVVRAALERKVSQWLWRDIVPVLRLASLLRLSVDPWGKFGIETMLSLCRVTDATSGKTKGGTQKTEDDKVKGQHLLRQASQSPWDGCRFWQELVLMWNDQLKIYKCRFHSEWWICANLL